MGENGRVVLRVELDAGGRMGAIHVETSSGSPRLDTAAVTAVKTWRCNPATQGGQPVPAVALQAFNFKVEG
jgi:protein TonB